MMNRTRPYPPSPLLRVYLRHAIGTRSQPEVARVAGISRPGLNRVLTGVTASPAPDTCARLASAIDAPLLHILALAGWFHLWSYDGGLAAISKGDEHYRFGAGAARHRPPLAEALDRRGSTGGGECLHALLRRQQGMQEDAERAEALEAAVRTAAAWVESWALAGDQTGTIGDTVKPYADRAWDRWREWDASRGQKAGLLAEPADVPLLTWVVHRTLWPYDGQGWAHVWLCGLIGEDVEVEAGLAALGAAYRAIWDETPPALRLEKIDALGEVADTGANRRGSGDERGEYYLRRTGRGQAVLRINFRGADQGRFDALLRDIEDRLAREFVRGR